MATGPGNDDVIGRWERWEIRFNVQGRTDYAKQLDFFGIELAAFGGGENVIESASNLASVPTRTVNRDPKSERRLYFSWKRSNPLVEFDRQLLAAAGVTTSGRNVVRLIPQYLEQQLAQLEKQFCEDNGKVFPDDIAKTALESRANGDGFEFKIISQRYRTN